MNILITNDDGINAEGILELAKAMKAIEKTKFFRMKRCKI